MNINRITCRMMFFMKSLLFSTFLASILFFENTEPIQIFLTLVALKQLRLIGVIVALKQNFLFYLFLCNVRLNLL